MRLNSLERNRRNDLAAEASVAHVVRIEFEADEAARQTGVGRELVEQSGTGTATVEVQVGRRVLRSRVDDVERPGKIVDEEPAGRA
jgi:hypothetical protein